MLFKFLAVLMVGGVACCKPNQKLKKKDENETKNNNFAIHCFKRKENCLELKNIWDKN